MAKHFSVYKNDDTSALLLVSNTKTAPSELTPFLEAGYYNAFDGTKRDCLNFIDEALSDIPDDMQQGLFQTLD